MNFDELDPVNHDDTSVLRVLLHEVKGLSPISGNALELIPLEQEDTI